MGIRVFDIRVGFTDPEIVITRWNEDCTLYHFHGSAYLDSNWDETVKVLEDWIAGHPGELLIVKLKLELPNEKEIMRILPAEHNPVTDWLRQQDICRGKRCDERCGGISWWQQVRRVSIDQVGEKSRLWRSPCKGECTKTLHDNPWNTDRQSDMVGKITLIESWSQLAGEDSSGQQVSDWTLDKVEKWKEVQKNGIETIRDSGKLYVVETSSVAFPFEAPKDIAAYQTPREIATYVNPKLEDRFDGNGVDFKHGIYMMDFADKKLATLITSKNIKGDREVSG